MVFKFKWKERDTQQAVLFWASVGLLIYWGVRGNFNVNELIIGIVIYVLTGQFLFGRGDKHHPPPEEIQRLEKKTESGSERETTSSSGDSGNSNFRYRTWGGLRNRRVQPRCVFQ